jgi:hypothetical protein
MKNQPTKIYLNIGADGECQDFEVSWCEDRINDDLEYISVSSVLARIEELKQERMLPHEQDDLLRGAIYELTNLIRNEKHTHITNR